ncbi:hypothetical protein [Acinetobacter sp. YH12120]|uniref:hypothetical protein n=1 Tax=Acinetobacter sp. YH12120 TaxID=2601107 RepID=UPI0015D28724|nr:hypothetical protein [Acinetobacter sp. YH12120]
MIDGNELLRRFLKAAIEKPSDEALIDELIKAFYGVLHFYKCLQGHPIPYHDITQFIYNYKTEIRIEDINIVLDAIELKLEKLDTERNDITICFRKFRRNISLAVTQKYYIQKVANDALNRAEEAEQIAKKATNMSTQANETLQHAKQSAKRAEDVASRAQLLANEANEQIKETKKTSESMMINYVTILGIFATIIITVFGGINIIGSTVKLLEGNSKLAYLVFVVSFLMICLLVLIRTLTSWISSLNNFKEDKVIVSSPKSFFKKSIFWFIVIVVLSGLVVIFNQVNKPEPKEETTNSHNKSNVVLMNVENLNQK